MKDYGVTKSWAKIFTIEQATICEFFGDLIPLQFVKSSEVLLGYDTGLDFHLDLYDIKRAASINLKAHDDCDSYSYTTSVFAESLVSLNSGTYVGQHDDDPEDEDSEDDDDPEDEYDDDSEDQDSEDDDDSKEDGQEDDDDSEEEVQEDDDDSKEDEQEDDDDSEEEVQEDDDDSDEEEQEDEAIETKRKRLRIGGSSRAIDLGRLNSGTHVKGVERGDSEVENLKDHDDTEEEETREGKEARDTGHANSCELLDSYGRYLQESINLKRRKLDLETRKMDFEIRVEENRHMSMDITKMNALQLKWWQMRANQIEEKRSISYMSIGDFERQP
ncbi:probable ATP-dependent RNA helicase ddx56 [Papaver somniferum]|uniref:probable ATP-dependent RNA helicase ddx56 n=1 Tax=Papaver somniferum TaxID=3469 RepID=UPI000E6F6AF3|nr:probable ATP-dependent RNA helicase ddx56 [Papaver somniferum]